MPIPTITTPAGLIKGTANSGGGYLGGGPTLAYPGTNSVWEVGGVWYVLVVIPPSLAFVTDPGVFQVRKSTDSGVTWSDSGASFSVTGKFGGGMTQSLIGTKIYVAYSRGQNVLPHDAIFYLNYFDTATETWGVEVNTDLSVPFGGRTIYGIYKSYLRGDGSLVYILSDNVGPDVWCLTYDGAFHGPFQITPAGGAFFESSVQRSDDTIDIFYLIGFPGNFYHQKFLSNNTVTAQSQIVYVGQLDNWDGNGLGYGFLDTIFYLACGLDSSDPGTFGKPIILFGDDGAWTASQIIDTSPAITGFSVVSTTLLSLNGYLIYYYRATDNGTNYIDRIGYAVVGSHNTPAAWTWATVYDFRTPAVPVPTEATPYDASEPINNIAGALTGLMQTASDIRIVTSIRNAGGTWFVGFLMNVFVSAAPAVQTRSPYLDGNTLPIIVLPEGPYCDPSGGIKGPDIACQPARLKG